MSCVDDPTELLLGNVDHYLGDRNTRFFGEGYKRANHRITDIVSVIEADAGPSITATASVDYPADWSRKADADQQPHLSTLDVLLLGVQLAEVWLAWHGGLDDQARRSAWIRQAHIKAGTAPVEDELAAIAIVARRRDAASSPTGPDRTVSTLECTVGTLVLRLDVDHPAASTGEAAVDPLGSQRRRPFGDAYRARAQRVHDVTVAPDRLRATARVQLQAWDGAATPGLGIEGDYQPSIGLIDAFVVALQLGQIMLYELDGLTRAASNTLWMRTTQWRASTPVRPDAGTHRVVVELRDAALLHNRKGATWRRADIVAELGAIAVTCSVAHQLTTGIEKP